MFKDKIKVAELQVEKELFVKRSGKAPRRRVSLSKIPQAESVGRMLEVVA